MSSFAARLTAVMAGTLLLAAASGYAIAHALAATPPAPSKTVTITVSNGATGPTGPTGDTGPGAFDCPSGFEPGILVINHPQGQATIYACLSRDSK